MALDSRVDELECRIELNPQIAASDDGTLLTGAHRLELIYRIEPWIVELSWTVEQNWIVELNLNGVVEPNIHSIYTYTYIFVYELSGPKIENIFSLPVFSFNNCFTVFFRGWVGIRPGFLFLHGPCLPLFPPVYVSGPKIENIVFNRLFVYQLFYDFL